MVNEDARYFLLVLLFNLTRHVAIISGDTILCML
jgi:hypothetical protein